jgi:hypothetical protein
MPRGALGAYPDLRHEYYAIENKKILRIAAAGLTG